MTDKDPKEVYLDLFIHPGWELLREEWKEALHGLIQTAHTLNTVEELHKRKGEIQKLMECLAFEDMVKMQIDEAMRDGDAV